MTTEELAAALRRLRTLPPLERAEAARRLKKEAAAVLDAEAAEGMAGAIAGGMTAAAVAKALGTSGPRLSAELRAHGLPSRATGRPPKQA